MDKPSNKKNDRKLKFFIAYESTNGKDIAILLKKSLEKNVNIVEEAFIDEDIPKGTQNEFEYRKRKIEGADYFILILTPRGYEKSKALRKEVELALDVMKRKERNFILIAQMKGADIPKRIETFQRLSQEPFENKFELARKLDEELPNLLLNIIKQQISVEEHKHSLMKKKESELINIIKQIIDRNETIYFYHPIPPIENIVKKKYLVEISKLLDDAKNKNIHILFCWKPFIEKIKRRVKRIASIEPEPYCSIINKILLENKTCLTNAYTKIILSQDSIFQQSSIDEGMIFGEDTKEGLIWYKPSVRNEIYVKYENPKTIKELFIRNYND